MAGIRTLSSYFVPLHQNVISNFLYLFPKIVCIRVQTPDTKKMVLMISLKARGLFAKHIGTDRTKGMATVDPNMVR